MGGHNLPEASSHGSNSCLSTSVPRARVHEAGKRNILFTASYIVRSRLTASRYRPFLYSHWPGCTLVRHSAKELEGHGHIPSGCRREVAQQQLPRMCPVPVCSGPQMVQHVRLWFQINQSRQPECFRGCSARLSAPKAAVSFAAAGIGIATVTVTSLHLHLPQPA